MQKKERETALYVLKCLMLERNNTDANLRYATRDSYLAL